MDLDVVTLHVCETDRGNNCLNLILTLMHRNEYYYSDLAGAAWYIDFKYTSTGFF